MHDDNLQKDLYALLDEGRLDRAEFFQKLTRTVAQEIACSRVSFWFYDGPQKDRIICESAYDANDNQWSDGVVLSKDDGYEPYFEAMLDTGIIVAPDSRNHAATSCLNEVTNTYSLLDVGIEVDGSQVGLICCEQAGAVKEWSEADVQYVRQAVAMVSQALKELA